MRNFENPSRITRPATSIKEKRLADFPQFDHNGRIFLAISGCDSECEILIFKQGKPMNDHDSLDPFVEMPPRKKKMGCFWRCVILILSCILALYLVIQVLVVWLYLFSGPVPLRISPETTFITEPRTADDQWVDYCKAFELKYYPPKMKTDDNGYRLIAEHLGIPVYYTLRPINGNPRKSKDYVRVESPERLAQAYEKLGLNPDHEPTLSFEDPVVFIENSGEFEMADSKKLAEKITRHPWTSEEFPAMQKWLDGNSPALELIQQAVRKSEFFIPLVYEEENDAVHSFELLQQNSLLSITGSKSLTQFRSYARGFAVRINHRLGTGDIDGAIEDIITCRQLADRIGKQKTLISAIYGIGIESEGIEQGIAGNPQFQPNGEQIRQLLRLQNELPPRVLFEDTLEAERLNVLDSLQVTAKYLHRFIPFDWSTVFRRVNAYFDVPLEDTPNKEDLGFSDLPRLAARQSRSELFADFYSVLSLTGVKDSRKTFWRNECRDQMQRITLGLLLHNAEQGRLPPAFSLDAGGRPLHSWRVLLLPYLENEEAAELYAAIRLDEPWDSEHNRQYHDRCPALYRCPARGNRTHSPILPSETTYSVILGEKTAFGTNGQGRALSDFGPESGGMVLLVEARTPVCWMNPHSDLPFEEAKLGADVKTGGAHPYRICNIGLRSGAMSSIMTNFTPPEEWERMLLGTATKTEEVEATEE